MTAESDRVSREREWHNTRYAEDAARVQRVSRFYLAVAYGFDLYRQRVRDAIRDRRVLEYGCGVGAASVELATVAQHVRSIDISDVAVQQARDRARSMGVANVDFEVDNAESLSLSSGSVDAVVGAGIIHHLDVDRAAREIRRVLVAGGTAVFAEPMGHNPMLNWYRNRTPELRTPDEHPLLVSDLRTMRRHFCTIRVTYFGLLAPLLGLVSMAPDPHALPTRLVWRLDRWLCRIPFLNRLAWYAVIELSV